MDHGIAEPPGVPADGRPQHEQYSLTLKSCIPWIVLDPGERRNLEITEKRKV